MFWGDVDLVAQANDIAVPLLQIGGWYDTSCAATWI